MYGSDKGMEGIWVWKGQGYGRDMGMDGEIGKEGTWVRKGIGKEWIWVWRG